MRITDWPGDGLVVPPPERIGEGEHRTTKPVPPRGIRESLLRIHDGRALPAVDGVPRQAEPEADLLQRELAGSGSGVWAVACPLARGRRPGDGRPATTGRLR